MRLYEMCEAIDTCPAPVIARVHGYALGGGSGLVACSDIAVAAPDAVFGFSEVRLGIIPAVISPFVLPKIGAAARRYFLTGERFDAGTALRIGLVHEVSADPDDGGRAARCRDPERGARGDPRRQAPDPAGVRAAWRQPESPPSGARARRDRRGCARSSTAGRRRSSRSRRDRLCPWPASTSRGCSRPTRARTTTSTRRRSIRSSSRCCGRSATTASGAARRGRTSSTPTAAASWT